MAPESFGKTDQTELGPPRLDVLRPHASV